MAALDEQEAEANAGGPVTALEAAEVVAYLRDLARLWDDAPLSRRALAEALFERVEVLGLRRMWIEPTPSAIAAGLVEASSRASAGCGRGERARPDGTDVIPQDTVPVSPIRVFFDGRPIRVLVLPRHAPDQPRFSMTGPWTDGVLVRRRVGMTIGSGPTPERAVMT